ncbi:hypothetical protein EYC80_006801 [Monilinia laxa]|uniref:Uncharacterized protein n=1 Tax=Monilinia laxa TaxID=61186 RepID=A0A5N6JZ94_MONLA|nr:hypothetical protein EYC80_006801 [Monilinia laxa]
MTALKAVDLPALGFAGVGNSVDLVLYTIQFYSYNVMALMVLFWAVNLFCGSWEIRANFLGGLLREHISLISKLFAITIPALLIGLGHAPLVLTSLVATFLLSNFTMLVSLSIGSILMVLILYKYIKTRRLLFEHEKRNGWWGSSGTATASDMIATGHGNANASGSVNDIGNGNHTSTGRSLYDRALITRFTIGFVILLTLEVVLIVFSLNSERNFQRLAKSSSPDFSIPGCITDIILFIPGVTTSLLVFLVFGTAKSWRQYQDLIISGCGLRTKFPKSKRRGVIGSGDDEQGTEFQRLPSMATKVPTPGEQAVLEAKMRGMLPDQRTSIGTQYTTQTEKTRPESSVYTYHARTLSPTANFNFSRPASARNEFRPVIREEEGDAAEGWARQNDLEIGLALEQKWSDYGDSYRKETDSAGNMTAGHTLVHGDLGSMSHRDFILDDSDEHEIPREYQSNPTITTDQKERRQLRIQGLPILVGDPI